MLAVACELWERGIERTEERIIKGHKEHKESFGCVSHIHYLACVMVSQIHTHAET